MVKKTTPKELIDKVLTPYADAYSCLRCQEYVSTSNAEKVNAILYWLNKIDNYDWMPPAIAFLAGHDNDSAYLLWFMTKLERLASFLHITAQDVNRRMDRYKWLLAEMDSKPNHSMTNPLTTIELTDEEKSSFLRVLDGEIYTMPSRRRNYVVQRLDSIVADSAAKYDVAIFSIEHVLPQNPEKGSEWDALWPDQKEREYWVNRIANLVPLTRKHNSQAQNYDFDKKKKTYFQIKKGTSYTLTMQLANLTSWTPSTVKNRQQELLDAFSKAWDLHVAPALPGNTNDTVFHLVIRGCNATGVSVPGSKFCVKKGSVISSDTVPSCPQGYIDQRNNLISQGIINKGAFTQDYVFDSVTAAASVVGGRAANGRKEWSTLDGRPYGKVIGS